MVEVEITTRLKSSLEEAIKVLENNGFKNTENGKMRDLYLTSKLKELNENNIDEVLAKTILIRRIENDGEKIYSVIYKNKNLDDNKNVISEEKLKIPCDEKSLISAEKIFKHLDFEELVKVEYEMIVFEKDGVGMCFQNVKNLGILIEYELKEDFTDRTTEEVKNEQKKALNFLKSLGLNITEEINVKKAKELIQKKYNF